MILSLLFPPKLMIMENINKIREDNMRIPTEKKQTSRKITKKN